MSVGGCSHNKASLLEECDWWLGVSREIARGGGVLPHRQGLRPKGGCLRTYGERLLGRCRRLGLLGTIERIEKELKRAEAQEKN